MKQESQSYQKEFYERLIARRPDDRRLLESMLLRQEGGPALESTGFAEAPSVTLSQALENYGARVKAKSSDGPALESTFDAPPVPLMVPPDLALETIVLAERPVFFVKEGKVDTQDATILGMEAEELVEKMKDASAILEPLLPLIGRIDVVNFPNNMPFVGTGWFVDNDIVVTNRHVASLIARRDGLKYVFSLGMGGEEITSTLCNGHEFGDGAPNADRVFKVKEVLYIERDNSPNDIAFLRVEQKSNGNGNAPRFIEVADSVGTEELVCVVGYPARAPQHIIPDQNLMQSLFRGRFDIKRAAPGYTMTTQNNLGRHDCATLGGNSGSVLLNLKTGKAVGLHFSGRYMEANYTVGAPTLSDYVKRKHWNNPINIKPPVPNPENASGASAAKPKPPEPPPVSAAGNSITIPLNIPLTITVSVGQLGAPGTTTTQVLTAGSVGVSQRPLATAEAVEEAVASYWQTRPEGVLAARVGYLDKDDAIGDEPCIAVSVTPALLPGLETNGIQAFQGIPVRYYPAEPGEQIEAMPEAETAGSIAYDDSARGGAKFSFEAVREEMEVILHVGPEYSWSTLKTFLEGTRKRMVSAIYEFHAKSVKDVIEERLQNGVDLKLVMDNATLSSKHDTDQEINAKEVFEGWASAGTKFEYIVVPEGVNGLISNAYHIKVTVRDDDYFWLSSGNWKMSSSQPEISDEELEAAAAGQADLPGNREWHVVIKNETLASRFRNHILQDFKRSEELGAQESPTLGIMDEIFVDVPIEESMVLERRAPNRVLEPLKLKGLIKVRPLLTPDREGAVYSEAVLQLIRSAKKSLLFQIPYIGMRPNPRVHRGYIDDLIEALTDKLTSLEDARVILRSGGSKFSSPTHAAWHFKSKGVDIDERLRSIENHHTKGMIVDGKRVLIGSHNWSQPGVTLNRDASLIFDDKRAAEYYAEAFEIDWERSNKIRPKRFVKQTESPVLEATGDAPPAGYQRIPLSQWLKDE